MLAYTMILLAFVALSHAAPQFTIGDGSTILVPGGGTASANPVGPILLPPINSPEVRPGKRDVRKLPFFLSALDPVQVEISLMPV
ncbi:hypothetical protein BDP55DRAFT_407373 [Colletotrichum godetiae]|uniref:Uncharacterized protein n=1 Tax=Colletotrichum godetiae TaxID=1209918 RepID=A0AAJ0EX14_9PEZI|nr:uncharacterized protein BDP55DRAFT_407373 [Colletotrichum godetiae]KAK1689380.1 hypothetical protein BDP55DRAFT_407373 [Colletotrichum godetiae]